MQREDGLSETGFWNLVRADCERFNACSPTPRPLTRLRLLSLLTRPELMTLFLYRMSHYLRLNDWRKLSAFMYRLNLSITGADLHPDSRIGTGCLIVHTVGTIVFGTLGDRATLYARVVIMSDRIPARIADAPVIGDDVTLGSDASVVGPIRIANGVSVAPYSLVDESVGDAGCLIKAVAWSPTRKRRKSGS